ncbi:MAG: hypothetical protein ACE5J3_08800 [Methanosarcinales archaeon]
MESKFVKIDLKKVKEVEKNPKLVEAVVLKWLDKYKENTNLNWDDAMNSAAQELGLNNRAELGAMIYGSELFKELSQDMLWIKNLKIIETQGKEIIKEILGDKKVRINVS